MGPLICRLCICTSFNEHPPFLKYILFFNCLIMNSNLCCLHLVASPNGVKFHFCNYIIHDNVVAVRLMYGIRYQMQKKAFLCFSRLIGRCCEMISRYILYYI